MSASRRRSDSGFSPTRLTLTAAAAVAGSLLPLPLPPAAGGSGDRQRIMVLAGEATEEVKGNRLSLWKCGEQRNWRWH